MSACILKVQLFRIEVSPHRADYVVTNDPAQDSTEATQELCGIWKIEQLHREGKTGYGLGTLAPVSQGTHLAQSHWLCFFSSGSNSKNLRRRRAAPSIQLKHGLLDDSLIQQLRNPSLNRVLA